MANKKLTVLCMVLLLSACTYKEDLAPLNEVITSMYHTPAEVPADGVSKVYLFVELPAGALDAKRAVLFTTTKGVFEVENKNSITVTAQDSDSNGVLRKIAKATLIAGTEETTAIVTVSAQNYVQRDSIRFTRSYPDFLQISVDKLNYKPDVNAELMVTVQLKKTAPLSKVSMGQSVTLQAYDKNEDPIGNFRNKNLMVDGDGKVVNFFSIPASLNYTGLVKLKATANSSVTGQVADSVYINVIK